MSIFRIYLIAFLSCLKQNDILHAIMIANTPKVDLLQRHPQIYRMYDRFRYKGNYLFETLTPFALNIFIFIWSFSKHFSYQLNLAMHLNNLSYFIKNHMANRNTQRLILRQTIFWEWLEEPLWKVKKSWFSFSSTD